MATWPTRPSTIRTTDGAAGGGGHEVDQRDAAFLRIEDGFQDHRARTVVSSGPNRRLAGSDSPAPVVWRSDQRGKAGGAVEARPAQPVDRTVAADQRGAVAVADHRVVLDPRRILWAGGGRWIARIGLGLLGRARAGRTGHQITRLRAQRRPELSSPNSAINLTFTDLLLIPRSLRVECRRAGGSPRGRCAAAPEPASDWTRVERYHDRPGGID